MGTGGQRTDKTWNEDDQMILHGHCHSIYLYKYSTNTVNDRSKKPKEKLR